MKLRPLNDYVLVSHSKGVEKTSGGIIIPDTAKEKPQEGTVVAVGPGRKDRDGKRMEMEVKEGDRVVFSKYAGTEVKIEGENYLLMRENEILCILG